MPEGPRMHQSKVTAKRTKAQIVADLDHARLALVRHSARATEQVSPTAWLKRSIEHHRIPWIIGAGFAGLVTVRALFSFGSPKKHRDIFQKTGTKAWLFSLLQGPLVSFGQRAILNYASLYLKNHLKQPDSPHESERNPI